MSIQYYCILLDGETGQESKVEFGDFPGLLSHLEGFKVEETTARYYVATEKAIYRLEARSFKNGKV